MTIKGQPGTTPTVSQWVHNHPFGGLAQRSGSYLTDFRFTGHEYDDHSTFQFHYMGARYYDDRFGSFTSIDKASQFASGFNYGGNNPVIGSDPDGNFFALVPFAIGYLSHAYQTKEWGWEAIAAGAISSFAAGAGAALSSSTQLGADAISSGINSVGGSLLRGETPSISIGPLMLAEGRKPELANPFRGDAQSRVSAASGWLALGQDLKKLEYNLTTSQEERAVTESIRKKYDEFGWTDSEGDGTKYVEVTAEELGLTGGEFEEGSWLVSSTGDKPDFTLKKLQIDRNGDAVYVRRSKSFHLKYTKTEGGVFILGEVHFNRVPSRALPLIGEYGIGTLAHGFIEASHPAVPALYMGLGVLSGNDAFSGTGGVVASMGGYALRTTWRPLWEHYHKNRHKF